MLNSKVAVAWGAALCLAMSVAAKGDGLADRSRLETVRLAVRDLEASFGERYPGASEYLARLDHLDRQFEENLDRAANGDKRAAEAIASLAQKLDALSREALLANPLLTGQPILLVTRHQYNRDHHNTATLFQTGSRNANNYRGGSALQVLDLAAGGRVTELIDAPQGIVRDPDVSFDGSKILFSLRRDKTDDQHIYEINADGTGLTQLTLGSGIADTDPIYLPSGEIIFSSTRNPKECPCNVHPQQNLFVMAAGGSNARQLTYNTVSETHSSLMPDGRVLYTRWEYVDKHWGPAQGLWTIYPDGTQAAVFFGNHSWWPGAILDGRIIPGTARVICTLGSCHAPPFGEIAIIDNRIGLDGVDPIVKSWPQQPVQRDGYDHVWNLPLRYEDPYPLSQKYFLAARTVAHKDDRYAIYLLDIFGNETLVYAHEELSCFDPMPLSPRPQAPMLAARHSPSQPSGQFIVADVYRGEYMERVERGTVKWLRIVEVPSKLTSSYGTYNNGATQAPAVNWSDTNVKKVLGRVPVEADGSASFHVPADKFVYFQLLDDDGMMVQSMRSGTMVRPGEVVTCAGCHEDRHTTVPNRPLAALNRPPSKIENWHGPPRGFSYAAEVQPVFERYCVSCHQPSEPAGAVLDLCGDKTPAFSISYQELHRRNLTGAVHLGPPEVLPPFAWGSHHSKLVEVIGRGQHYGVKLDPESFDRLVTWIDLNAPYYGTYASTRMANYGGRSPLNDQQLARLSELTGIDVTGPKQSHVVNLTRPELSAALRMNLPKEKGGGAENGKARFRDVDDPSYQEALAILKLGAADLLGRPRMDMPDATPDTRWIEFLDRLAAFEQAEATSRAAILGGGTPANARTNGVQPKRTTSEE